MITFNGEQFISDAVLRVTFLPTEKGGRRTEVGSNRQWTYYSCPLVAPDGTALDVRMFPHEVPLLFDREYEVEVIFLSPDKARTIFLPGTKFSIWEGRTVGHGVVVESTWGSGE